MGDIVAQVFSNLRANRLRSVLTMFGILWGVVSIVILSATGEGFQRGNQHVLEELGRNVAIVWGSRTSLQAGGERAGRRIFLTTDDARALARESSLISVVSPELTRNLTVKSQYNAGALVVTGVEPQYQDIRTIEVTHGRRLRASDNDGALRVAIIGPDAARQLFAAREAVGAAIGIAGVPYTVVGVIRKKDQDSDYNGQDNDKVIVPFAAMARDFPRTDADAGVLSNIIVAPTAAVVENLPRVLSEWTGRLDDIEWPLQREVRRVLAPRHHFDAADRRAVDVWDTSIESLMFGRMIDAMKNFFLFVGLVTLALGGLGVMNIMLVAVRERTNEIGLRKALGATPGQIQRQFFLEGLALTLVSGVIGFAVALAICGGVNTLPLPPRFAGLVVTWQAGAGAVAALVAIGVITSTYPARRAARLPPVEALRFER